MYNKLKTPNFIYKLTLILLTVMTFFLIGYTPYCPTQECSELIPTTGYADQANITVSGHEAEAWVPTCLPYMT